MLFTDKQRIVLIGDSITDRDRRSELYAPYGRGYVSMVRNLMTARYPERGLAFFNRGVNGNTVRHLAVRWDSDVIALKPDWVSIFIGINDCWRFFREGREREAVSLNEFEQTYRCLLERTRAATQARLILMQPYVIESNRDDPMRREMDRYCAVVGRLAEEYKAVLVPTQDAWDAALAHTVSTDWAEDRVHPAYPGHAVIALAFLRAVGFEW